MSRANISIAMATYNGERFLRQQLESIARQTLRPHELVVTDDCSSDSTPEIIEDFAQSAPFPVRLFRNDERLEYPDNFLKAASLCRSDFIAFSDQDDIWLSGKLARCAESFEDESVMLVVHSGKMVDEELRPTGCLVPEILRDAVTPPLTARLGQIHQGFAIVFRLSLPLLFNRCRPLASADQIESMTHDQWVCFLANVFGKTAYIREPLVLYRRHTTTVTKPRPLPIAKTARRSLSAGAESYIKMAQLAAQWAVFLDQAATVLPEAWRLSANKGAHHYRYVEALLLERSKIYRTDEHIWNRFGVLVRLMAQGEYGHQSAVGLGLRSALKDVLVGVLGVDRLIGKCFP